VFVVVGIILMLAGVTLVAYQQMTVAAAAAQQLTVAVFCSKSTYNLGEDIDLHVATTLDGTPVARECQLFSTQLPDGTYLGGFVITGTDGKWSSYIPTGRWPSGGTFEWWAVDTQTGIESNHFTVTVVASTPPPPPPPSGYFTINDQQISDDTVIYLTSPTMKVGFTATQSADQIVLVGFYLNEDDKTVDIVTLNKVSSTYWELSYTFTTEGTYDFVGFFKDSSGTVHTVVRMSVQYPAPTPPIEVDFSTIGMVLILVGLIVTVAGFISKRSVMEVGGIA